LDIAVFYALGIALVIVGIVILVAAIVLASRGSVKEGKSKVKGAGVIMIGPIPIIFGTDKKSVKTVLALALALTIVVLIIFLLDWFLR
jgi:uncharacterized protein (TIGR00304 family)